MKKWIQLVVILAIFGLCGCSIFKADARVDSIAERGTLVLTNDLPQGTTWGIAQ